jgi:hypothetical protein
MLKKTYLQVALLKEPLPQFPLHTRDWSDKAKLGGWFQIGDPFYSYMRYIVYIVYDNLKHPPFNKKNNKFTDTSIIKINCKTDWTKF